MQSGISASEELHTAFKSLLSNPSQRGLLVTISSSPESLQPAQVVDSTASNFSSDLDNLSPHITEKQAAYVILKQDVGSTSQQATGNCIAITYVPDTAPVRQKMLFASTRLTLVRELGTEHFSQTLFATLPSEITADGWAKHEAHGSLSAPLTREEQDLVGIREAEAQESTGTAARRGGHVASDHSLPVDDAAKQALEKLAQGADDVGLVQLEIDVAKERILLVSTSPSMPPSELAKTIAAEAPRYSFYSYPPANKILFIYTNPPSTNINIKSRMLYAASRATTERVIAQNHGITVSGKLETGDPSDITEAEVAGALGLDRDGQNGADENGGSGTATPVGAAGTLGKSAGFARPKRPGKR